METETAYRTLRHHLSTVQGVEVMFAVLLVAVLNALFLENGVRAIDRAELTTQLLDLAIRRQYVAEHLALTGLLPNEWLGDVQYSFDFMSEASELAQYQGLVRSGFRERQQEIEQGFVQSGATPVGDLAKSDEQISTGGQWSSVVSGRLGG